MLSSEIVKLSFIDADKDNKTTMNALLKKCTKDVQLLNPSSNVKAKSFRIPSGRLGPNKGSSFKTAMSPMASAGRSPRARLNLNSISNQGGRMLDSLKRKDQSHGKSLLQNNISESDNENEGATPNRKTGTSIPSSRRGP